MLALAFHIGASRYALASHGIVEVVPRVELRAVPHAPTAVAGTFTYRGSVVPTIDLCTLLLNTRCSEVLSTRIIVVRISRVDQSASFLVGLLAEKVYDTITLDASTKISSNVSVQRAPYLGDVHMLTDSAVVQIQLLRIEHLLVGELLDVCAAPASSDHYAVRQSRTVP
jgi:chemotaxis-related protein WspB